MKEKKVKKEKKPKSLLIFRLTLIVIIVVIVVLNVLTSTGTYFFREGIEPINEVLQNVNQESQEVLMQEETDKASGKKE